MRIKHTPVEIKANLRQGVMLTPPHDLDLAGILATQHRQHLKAAGRTLADTTGSASDYPLPLARCHHGDEWHWQATTAILPDNWEREHTIGWGTSRPHVMSPLTPKPFPAIHQHTGPYRNRYLHRTRILTPHVTWRAIGDPEVIARLITPITHVGKRRTVGEGRVLRWEITTPTPDNPEQWVHTTPDGHLAHPAPPECAALYTTRPTYPISYAIRPPSWHPDRLAELVTTTPEWNT